MVQNVLSDPNVATNAVNAQRSFVTYALLVTTIILNEGIANVVMEGGLLRNVRWKVQVSLHRTQILLLPRVKTALKPANRSPTEVRLKTILIFFLDS